LWWVRWAACGSRACAPFQKQTGKTVDVVLGAPLQWLNQIAANPKHPPLDVITSILVFPPYKEIGKLQGAWIEQRHKEIG